MHAFRCDARKPDILPAMTSIALAPLLTETALAAGYVVAVPNRDRAPSRVGDRASAWMPASG